MATQTQHRERDFVGYGKDYPKIAWPNKARIAISLVVNYEEGSERSLLYGDATGEPRGEGFFVPAGTRDMRTESIFAHGSRVGVWRLLDIFHRHDVKSTFFACALSLDRNRVVSREVTARGHEPSSHGYRYYPSFGLSREEEREHIRKAVELTQEATGQRCVGWFSRCPTIQTRELLIEEGGFLYDNDSFADDLPYFVSVSGRKWPVLPYTLEINDMKYWFPPGYSDPDDFVLQMKAAFDCLYEEGETHPKMMTIGLHSRYSGKPSRTSAIDEFIRYAKGFPGVWFARRIDIAKWFVENYSHLPTLPLSKSHVRA